MLTVFSAQFLPSNLWRCYGQVRLQLSLREDELDGMPRGRSRRSRSLTRPEVRGPQVKKSWQAENLKIFTANWIYRLEMQGETGRIFGNSRWVGIFCAKDVVHFVRVMPPPPPVLVLPVPAWASMLVICCRWLFFALKQLLARLASILCNRRLSELRVQLLMLLCQISACRYARSKGWTQTLTSQIVVGVMVPFLEHDIEYHGLLNLVVSWRHSMIWAKPQTWRIRGCYFDDG